MVLSIPVRLADGPGNVPAAANWNDDYDWLTSIMFGLGFINNGGMELWSAGTSFSNPANGTVLADSWTEIKTGTSLCTADVTREASVVDSGTYSMKVNITGAGSLNSYWAITQSVSTASAFGNLTVLVGVRIKVSTANKVRVSVYDGATTAYSAYHTGDGTWQLLQAKLVCQTTPTEVTITIEINPSNFTDAVYIDSSYLYVVPAAISARAQAALIFTPLSAETGSVGAYISASVASATNTPADSVYGDATSISLSGGDWDVTGIIQFTKNTATSWDHCIAGISTHSGNSSTGLVQGDTSLLQTYTGGTIGTVTQMDFVIPAVRMSLGSTTTVYLKMLAGFGGGQPQYTCRLSARRAK